MDVVVVVENIAVIESPALSISSKVHSFSYVRIDSITTITQLLDGYVNALAPPVLV